MTHQLRLIERPAAPLLLDDATRARGRQGIATARAALAEAPRLFELGLFELEAHLDAA